MNPVLSGLKRVDRSVFILAAAIVVLLVGGSFYKSEFLTVHYMLQQLHVATFLGILATGAMVVILLGHIDLSMPWVLTVSAMMATAVSSEGGWATAFAIPSGLAVGVLIGLINGLMVAYMRVPSMIITLAVNAVLLGLAVLYTGGFAPQTKASEVMLLLGQKRSIVGIPNMIYVWLVVAAAVVFVLKKTPLGRHIYAIGNRERATYLSGVNTRLVLIICFAIAGFCSALGGVMLAGYVNQSYQAMGDVYLLPAIAAVVLGGTNILGGRGTYLGTIGGVLVITLLQSILSVMQMQDSWRQIIYGLVIIAMLLLHGRSGKVRTA
jgi:ribose transport system permease protein